MSLFGMGFRGKTALAIHRIFAKTFNSIKLEPGVYTAPFEQTDGVWQGSSPSMLLASLVFENVIHTLNRAFPAGHASGTPLTEAGDPLNVLVFCDDLVLLCITWEGLKKRIDKLCMWSPGAHITPHTSSTRKPSILVFGESDETELS